MRTSRFSSQKNEYPIIDGRLTTGALTSPRIRTPLPEPTLQLLILALGESDALLSSFNAIEGNFRDAKVANPPLPELPLDRGRLVQKTKVWSPAFGTYVQRPVGGTDEAVEVPQVARSVGKPDSVCASAVFWRARELLQKVGGCVVYRESGQPRCACELNGAAAPTNVTFRRRSVRLIRRCRPQGRSNRSATRMRGCAAVWPDFYSAGPDHDPGMRDDNVYTDTPAFPSETSAELRRGWFPLQSSELRRAAFMYEERGVVVAA